MKHNGTAHKRPFCLAIRARAEEFPEYKRVIDDLAEADLKKKVAEAGYRLTTDVQCVMATPLKLVLDWDDTGSPRFVETGCPKGEQPDGYAIHYEALAEPREQPGPSRTDNIRTAPPAGEVLDSGLLPTRPDSTRTPPAAERLPDGVLDSAARGGSMLDAYARTPQGLSLLAHSLTQLARDGWLRTEPGDGIELYPEPTEPEPQHSRDEYADPRRPFTELSDSGLLWLINRTLFHPSGLALAVHTDEDGTAYGWSLLRSPDGEPWTYDAETDADRLHRAETTLAAALGAPAPDTPGQSDRTAEDDRPATGGLVRTVPLVGEVVDCGPLATRPDAVPTCPDSGPSDTDTGVRVEYRATVPRHMVGHALAEALGAIARETGTADAPPSTEERDRRGDN